MLKELGDSVFLCLDNLDVILVDSLDVILVRDCFRECVWCRHLGLIIVRLGRDIDNSLADTLCLSQVFHLRAVEGFGGSSTALMAQVGAILGADDDHTIFFVDFPHTQQ